MQFEEGKPLRASYEGLMKDVLDEINVYGIMMHNNFNVNKNGEMMSRRMSCKEAMESLLPWRFFLAWSANETRSKQRR